MVALQPKDTVAAQSDPAARQNRLRLPRCGAVGQPPAQAPAPGFDTDCPTLFPMPHVKEGRLEGTWTAQPDPETTITLSFLDQGRFTWKVAHKGQDRLIQGKLTSGNGLLTLAQDQGAPMVGNVTWSDETHFTFKVPGAGPDDPRTEFHQVAMSPMRLDVQQIAVRT